MINMITKIKLLLGIMIAATLPVSGLFAYAICLPPSKFVRSTLFLWREFYLYLISVIVFISAIVIPKRKYSRLVEWFMIWLIILMMSLKLVWGESHAQIQFDSNKEYSKYFEQPWRYSRYPNCWWYRDSTKQIVNTYFAIPFWIINLISFCLVVYKMKKHNEETDIK